MTGKGTIVRILTMVIGLGVAVCGEPPDYAKPVTSIKAYKDVDPAADYAGALEIVVDKYLLLGAYADDTFRPQERLRRGELAGWLDRSARRAEQLIEIVTDDYAGDKGKFRKLVYPDARQPKSLERFEQLKNLVESDPCYPPSHHLAEHFHLLVRSPKDDFGAQEFVSAEEYAGYLQALFHYKGGPKGKQPITRGEAVDPLCDAFQFYLDRVEEKMLGK